MNLKKILKEKGYQIIKLKTLPSGHHLIKAKINGKKGKFILDTGASNTFIDTNKAEKFGTKLKMIEHKATGAGTGEIDLQTTKKVHLEIGDWYLKNVKLVAIDMEHINLALEMFEVEVDGIIGADVLQSGKGIIQYHKDLLFLLPVKKKKKNVKRK